MVSSVPSTSVLILERRAYEEDRKGVPERSRKTRRVGSIGKRMRVFWEGRSQHCQIMLKRHTRLF